MKFSIISFVALLITGSIHALPMNEASSSNLGPKPKRYIRNSQKVMITNPEWTEWNNKKNGLPSAPPMKGALAVISNMDDLEDFNEISKKTHVFSESTASTFDFLQKEDISKKIGLDADETVEELGRIFAKYEVPIGLMKKLMVLGTYDVLEFIIDDSGSMTLLSDTKDALGRPETRWQEAISRMKSLIEIMAYVPTPNIVIRFLNRKNEIKMRRNGESPEDFIAAITKELDAATKKTPYNGTPAFEILKESFERWEGKKVARYVFGDGVPDGGLPAQRKIKDMVINRENPADNPLTFFSCSNIDSQVEWMKEVEEVAVFCSEYDDYSDESDEVMKDQGKGLPFTPGFYLVGSLVAAMNPDDLDAMDESVPFTKATLDDLLGIVHAERDYKYYFDEFCRVQRHREGSSRMDAAKRNMKWSSLYMKFLKTDLAKNIPEVVQFKKHLADLLHYSR